MLLQEKIEKEIKALSRKKEKVSLRDNLKYIKSEAQKVGKVVEDSVLIAIIQKFIKNESALPTPDTEVIEFLKQYLPVEMTDEEVIAWIHQNIDFGSLPNKMAAMKIAMAGLKGAVAGARLRTILEAM